AEIGNIDAAVGRDPNAQRILEQRLGGWPAVAAEAVLALGAGEGGDGAVGRVHLSDHLIEVLGYVDVVLGVEADVPGVGDPGAGAGDGVDEPGGVDLADPAVVGVGDDEVALGVDANVLGGVESAAQRGATIGGVRAVGAGNHVLLRRDAREGVDLSVRGL